MQKIKLKTEESGKKLLEAYAPPKWSETADDDDWPTIIQKRFAFNKILCEFYGRGNKEYYLLLKYASVHDSFN